MAKLILVRHAEPRVDRDEPTTLWSLSEGGRQRAGLLASRLSNYAPRCVYSSPETKAVATAEQLAVRWSIEVKIEQGLEEHHRRSRQFLPQDQFNAAVQAFFSEPAKLKFGEETADQAYQRFVVALERALVAEPEGDVVVVTHGTILSLYLARLSDADAFSIWSRLGMPAYAVVDRARMALESLITEVSEISSDV